MPSHPLSSGVPEIRVQTLNQADPADGGDYVLYWMIAHRRTTWNYSLERAIDWAEKLAKPLVVLEALRCDYRWASDRFHYFVIQGMADNARRLEPSPVTYYPYLEKKSGGGDGLVEELARRAAVVVSDDFPTFFLPRMVRQVARKLDVRFEMVDSNGLYPMRATDKVFSRAYDFRRHLQKELPPHLHEFPKADPVADAKLSATYKLLSSITDRWAVADVQALASDAERMSEFPIDHEVRPASFDGGAEAAEKCLRRFLDHRLERYADERSQPESDAASGLSPYLHFGHISVHEVFAELASKLDWTPDQLTDKRGGQREGFWGMPPEAESFLDELITWREVGYNFCSKRGDYNRYSSLPEWAKQTLAEHTSDHREHVYDLETFEQARTHDDLWNAAQRQLVVEGRMHNYLRMLWGKKILHWTKTPQDALAIMIELNNKYAVDGRNPNSYSGIFWVLGRYDRAWGPERDIFGKIRYMTSDNTKRKLNVKEYIRRYSPKAQGALFD